MFPTGLCIVVRYKDVKSNKGAISSYRRKKNFSFILFSFSFSFYQKMLMFFSFVFGCKRLLFPLDTVTDDSLSFTFFRLVLDKWKTFYMDIFTWQEIYIACWLNFFYYRFFPLIFESACVCVCVCSVHFSSMKAITCGSLNGICRVTWISSGADSFFYTTNGQRMYNMVWILASFA